MILTSLTIAGTDRKAYLAPGTLEIEDNLNARDICRFVLRDETGGTARPHVGQVVQVVFDGTLRFAGTIDRIEERNLRNQASPATLEYDVAVVDYNQLADRRLHAEIYEDFTMKAIVQDLVLDNLAADGVTLDPAFPTGPTIEFFRANYETVAALFDRLSEMTGYLWNIGPDKVLRFLDRTSLTAPASLTQTSGVDLHGTLRLRRTREAYRNEQFIRGGVTETDTIQTEQFKGDGAQRTFTTALPISRVPTVKVNGVMKTVGIRQVDTGKDWYWQEASTAISQDPSGAVLTAADTLTVEYRGYFPLLTIHREQQQIEDRQAVEGGTGVYQHLESDEDITNAQLARDRAAGLIRRFGTIHTDLEFETRLAGWQAGQLLPVSRAEHGLSGDFLIAGVTIRHDTGDHYVTRVRAVSGEAVESWVAFFARLAEARRISRRDVNEAKSTVTDLIRTASETVTIGESVATAVPTESRWEVGDEIGLSEVVGV